MGGGVALQSQALVESEELHIAGLAGSEEDEGTAFSPHASCAATSVHKGAADQNKRSLTQCGVAGEAHTLTWKRREDQTAEPSPLLGSPRHEP